MADQSKIEWTDDDLLNFTVPLAGAAGMGMTAFWLWIFDQEGAALAGWFFFGGVLYAIFRTWLIARAFRRRLLDGALHDGWPR